MTIALVTDSTADIPQELQSTFSISVMPNFIMIDGKTYRDGVDLTRKEFYEMMPSLSALPSTGTAPPDSYIELYKRLFKQGYERIISVHASGKLSGILNSVQVAAQSFAGKVSVVDSGSLSMGTGWQIIEAAEAIIKGYTVDRVLDCIEAIKRKVRVFAMLDTLEFVRRSGRVSWARASIGAMLSIKPFVELKEGVVLSYGQVRTWRKGFDYLLNIYRSLLPVRRLAVLHTNAEAEANQFIDALDLEGAARPLVINVTSAIGTHVGPHGLGFAVVQE